jgi:dihydroxyacetone kinase phosphoprotein-dependent L subunit
MKRALLFDCDGVLADTERDGHLVAFNRMWREQGVNWQWTLAQYAAKLKIGGGKERLASLAKDDDFRAAYPVPASEEEWQAIVGVWHKRKSEIFKELIASGAIPGRPGVRRLAKEALARDWVLAVCSTSALPSVQAVLTHVMGEDIARQFAGVFAGDIVQKKKPAPDIYTFAAAQLGIDPSDCVVVEDSRNGLLAATTAGMTCIVTWNELTRDEDFSEAAIVLSSLGDPDGEQAAVTHNRSQATPAGFFGVDDLEKVASVPGRASWSSLEATELVVRTIAETAIENEKYFTELDGVVGDGDFGISLASGFSKLVDQWDSLDRSTPGSVLKAVSMVIAGRVGGVSGAIWGTAFLRAAVAAGDKAELTHDDVIVMLGSAIEGMKKRGQSDLGDKTLLDAFVPATDELTKVLQGGGSALDALRRASQVAREKTEEIKPWVAKRGRASYTGERSRDTYDAGSVAIAVMAEKLVEAWELTSDKGSLR